jgi:protein tyrosine phosphatase (PTP) superfamily phosphohydrolase (DUF442 family)
MVKRERDESKVETAKRALMHTCESGTRALVYFNSVKTEKERKSKKSKKKEIIQIYVSNS